MKKGRQANFELLRILAMVMIVGLHYLVKGGAITTPLDGLTSTGYVAWFLEAFFLVAVNIYVILSGYFGLDMKYSWKRPLRIWGQVWFYSVVIGVLCMMTGLQQFDIYQVFMYLFPAVTEHYWFATAFLLLCICMPFLQAGAAQMEQKTFAAVLGLFLLFESLSKSILPMQLPWDHGGYDVVWFLCLYMTGLYLRRFGLPILQGKIWKGLVVYALGAGLIFGSMIVLSVIYQKTGSLGAMVGYAYTYNHVLCYIAALGLFVAFEAMPSDFGKITPVIVKVSGATFGVYLIHEHYNIRYMWPKWFACEAFANASIGSFITHMIVTMLCVYIGCTLIELGRQYLEKKLVTCIGKTERH